MRKQLNKSDLEMCTTAENIDSPRISLTRQELLGTDSHQIIDQHSVADLLRHSFLVFVVVVVAAVLHQIQAEQSASRNVPFVAKIIFLVPQQTESKNAQK